MYTRPLAADEVQDLFTASDVSTGTWRLDGNATAERGANGVLSGTPAWVAGSRPTRTPATRHYS